MAYAMNYKNCINVGIKMGYTKTKSWRQKGFYVTTKPRKKIKNELEKV
jgi:hypothetical protein